MAGEKKNTIDSGLVLQIFLNKEIQIASLAQEIMGLRAEIEGLKKIEKPSNETKKKCTNDDPTS